MQTVIKKGTLEVSIKIRFLLNKTTYSTRKPTFFIKMLRQKQVCGRKTGANVTAFGAPLKEMTWNAGADPNGFNGKRKDDEIYGQGNTYDYGARMYDARLGRPITVDPMYASFPELSTYQFASNTPIWAIDLDGKEARVLNNYDNSGNVTSIEIVVDIQVRNGSTKITQEEAMNRAGDIKNAIEQTFSGEVIRNGAKVPVSTTVNLTKANEQSPFVVDFEDEARKDDDQTLGYTDKIGRTQKNLFTIKATDVVNPENQNESYPITGDLAGTVGSHELGHGLGLRHKDPSIKNLMNPETPVKDPNSIRQLNPQQLDKVINKIQQQQPKNEPTPDNRSPEQTEGGEPPNK